MRVVEIKALTKSYGDTVALRDVSFSKSRVFSDSSAQTELEKPP